MIIRTGKRPIVVEPEQYYLRSGDREILSVAYNLPVDKPQEILKFLEELYFDNPGADLEIWEEDLRSGWGIKYLIVQAVRTPKGKIKYNLFYIPQEPRRRIFRQVIPEEYVRYINSLFTEI